MTSGCAQLLEDMPTVCHDCATALCLRQQVLNMALGELDEMLCLTCLARQNDKEPTRILHDLGGYVLSRECFAKEWRKYQDVSACPYPERCYPESCFAR